MSLTENLENMLATGNDSAMLRFGLGSSYFSNKQYQQAIPHLQKCLDMDDSHSAAYKLLGKSQIKLGLHEQAKATLVSGLDKAIQNGDKQTEREIQVILNKLSSKR